MILLVVVWALAPWIWTKWVTCDADDPWIGFRLALKGLHPTLEIEDPVLEVVDVLLHYFWDWRINPLGKATVTLVKVSLEMCQIFGMHTNNERKKVVALLTAPYGHLKKRRPPSP